MSSDINYVAATLAPCSAGGRRFALWGITVVTNIAFGLVAIASVSSPAWGQVKFASGKRSRGFAVDLDRRLARQLRGRHLPREHDIREPGAGGARRGLPPGRSTAEPRLVHGSGLALTSAHGRGLFSAIIVYEAWKIPRPLALRRVPSHERSHPRTSSAAGSRICGAVLAAHPFWRARRPAP